MVRRRSLLAAGASPLLATTAGAARPPQRGGALRVGADVSLVDSGLARSLQRSFGADTGIAVRVVAGPALAVLDAVRDGEVDAALLNVPDAEGALDAQGLVHDRKAIAGGDFVIVGPSPRGRAATPSRNAVELLGQLRGQALSDPGTIVFLSANDGSGVHVAEQALWRAAQIEPLAPWYAAADPSRGFIAQARGRSAYALVERGAWGVLGGPPLAVVAAGDPSLVETVHAMRSFRISHPAGKIFVAWISGRRGRAVVAAQRGYRAP